MPLRSNFNHAIKQITTCEKLGRALIYFNQFIEYHRTATNPYSETGVEFLVRDPADDCALIWDLEAWLRMKQTNGFSVDEIAKFHTMFEEYWSKAGRRRRQLGS
jgi:hypothetical protein